MPRSCDNCTMCCKLLGIKELNKPKGVWCPHCDTKHGCTIYATRPEECRTFECHWLTAPSDIMGEELKPNKCKVVFTASTDNEKIVAFVDPAYPMAWEKEPVLGFINMVLDRGVDVIIVCGDFRKLLSNNPASAAIEIVEYGINGEEP